MLEKILEQYPHSKLNKYGEFFELFFRTEEGKGCFKISGTQEQVKNTVNYLLTRFNND